MSFDGEIYSAWWKPKGSKIEISFRPNVCGENHTIDIWRGPRHSIDIKFDDHSLLSIMNPPWYARLWRWLIRKTGRGHQ